jgi:hypothetical protein
MEKGGETDQLQVLGRALDDTTEGAVFSHEIAYVLGQIQSKATVEKEEEGEKGRRGERREEGERRKEERLTGCRSLVVPSMIPPKERSSATRLPTS